MHYKTREGGPPWHGRWPCPDYNLDHRVLPDKDGNATFHYITPGGNLGMCPGTGKPIKELQIDTAGESVLDCEHVERSDVAQHGQEVDQ